MFRYVIAALSISLTLIAGASTLQASTVFLTDYQLALEQAQASGRPIFLDAFTTWCAPCKQMERDVFSLPEVGDFLEQNFIPLRLDMEQEPGLQLQKQFDIRQYPTLMVLDGAGEIHRHVGFLNAHELKAFAKTALDQQKNYRTLHRQFQAGLRSVELLTALTAYAKTAGIDAYEEYAYAYLLETDTWKDKQGQELLFEAVRTIQYPLFDSLVAHRKALSKTFSSPVVDERIARLLDEVLFGKNPAKPRQAKRFITRAYPLAADSTYIRYRMRRAREAGKAKEYGKYAIKGQRDFPTSDPDELEELIYVFETRLTGWKEEEVSSWKKRKAALETAQNSW